MRRIAVVAALFGLAAVVPSAQADLFVVARENASRALADPRVDVVASYRGFVLASAPPAAAGQLRAAGGVPRDDMQRVALQGRSVDPVRAQRRAPARDGLLVVQFVGPVKDEWIARLRASGARIVSYMAQNAYLVHARAADLRRRGAEVRAMFALGAADKIAPEVADSGTAAAQVQTLSGDDGAAARARLRGPRTRPALRVGPYVTEFVRVPRATLDALAADAGVVSIEPDGVLRAEDESQDQVLAGNVAGAIGPIAPGYLAWLRGRLPNAPSAFDFVVDVSDSGLDDGATSGPTVHPDLAGRVAYSDAFMDGSDANGKDCSGHGSLNAGIVGGFNDTQGSSTHEDANGYQYGLGVAPFVRIGSSKVLDSCGDNSPVGSFNDVAANAYSKGARITNNSWGFNDPNLAGAYTAVSQAYDAFVRDAQPAVPGNQEMVEIKSAGNAGNSGNQTISPPGTAKNLITVGATENVRAFGGPDRSGIQDSAADNITERIGFSGKGPTDDGRLKPDVMAPGTHVASTRSQASGYLNNGISGTDASANPFNAFYTASSGTSHSAPAVSGAAALIRFYFSTRAAGAFTPSPAMTKALLVSGARDQLIEGSAPNNAQGYGFVNLNETLSDAGRYFSDQAQRLDNSGEVATRTLTIPDTGAPAKITLAWTDPPGPTTGNAWVNDLDLEVEAGGQLYRGNNIAGSATVAGGSPDVRNNIEKVILPPGLPSPITVRVRATNIAGDGVPGAGDGTDQDFALATANVSAPPVVLAPASLPGGVVGGAYAQDIRASGGGAGAPYGFAVTAGAPPAGLSLSEDGTLAGTPTAPGTSSFVVSATDAGGQAGTRAYSLTVPTPPPPPGAPRVSGLKVGRSAISFTLDRAGRVVLRFERKLGGRRVGGRCVAPTRGNRGRGSCTRYRSRGQIVHTGRAGVNRVRFSGRVSGRSLPAGSYRLTAFGQLGDATTRVIRRSFRINRR
jgi:subtilisin family serine protease